MKKTSHSIPHNRRTSDAQTEERRERSDRRHAPRERRAHALNSEFIDAAFSAQIVAQSLDDRPSKTSKPNPSTAYGPVRPKMPRTSKTI